MDCLDRVAHGCEMTFGITQPVRAKKQLADLVIGGLLLVLALGGLAM
jgi:hypothetical protein